MITYEVDILDVATGEVKRVDSFVGWNEYSPKIHRETMCDCNLAATRNRELFQTQFGISVEAHELASFKWRAKNGGCDHQMPPKRMKVLKAYLQDGRVWDFERSAFAKAAA